MRHRIYAALASPLLLVVCGQALAQKKLLTLEQASGRGEPVSFSGRTPAWKWAPDGSHLVEGRGADARWIDPATGAESRPPERDAEREPEREPDQEDARGRRAPRSEQRKALREAMKAVAGEHELEELSPDGKLVAFVQGNDLELLEVATQEVRAITDSGGPERLNGKLDWVYQEEVYGRGDFKAFWWSPDSKAIAFLSLDESPVHAFTVVDHIEDGHFRVKPEVTKYPKAGDPNPSVRLGVARTGQGGLTWVDLSRYEESEPLIVRVGWTPDGSKVLFMVQDRIQTWLDLDLADPSSGAVTTLIHESSDSWVNRPRMPHWLGDGTFLWMSERTGYQHIYHHRADGTLIRPVTQGEWAVHTSRGGGESGIDIDEGRGLIWFEATKDGAVNSNTYRVALDGTGLVRLTQGDGRHSLTFNGDRSLFLDSHSSLARIPSVRLCSGEGEVLKELGTAEIPAREEYLASNWELVEIPARDGFPLDAAILKPVPFDPSERYAVWLPTYSGPNAPSVRNGWNGSAWYQFLAQRGICVLQVNVRSASGKGQVATSRCYKQLGVQELRDIEDAVAWLTAHEWADGTRVGIAGHSYGGFMAAYALTHSDKFALGIAGSGVHDWGMYDTIYTERYMSTPQLNPQGYAQTSVVKAAKDLHGHLVITHGTMDDNVHMQNALQLVYELQKAGKDFDLMLYPQSRHGIGDAEQRWFDRRLEWKSIQRHLRPREPEIAAGS